VPVRVDSALYLRLCSQTISPSLPGLTLIGSPICRLTSVALRLVAVPSRGADKGRARRDRGWLVSAPPLAVGVRQTTSFSLPVATSKTNPRTESLSGERTRLDPGDELDIRVPARAGASCRRHNPQARGTLPAPGSVRTNRYTRSSTPWAGLWSPTSTVQRLPGAWAGSDEIVSLARERGIPVYMDVADVPTAS
jgi:hypothetical protein